MSPVPKPDPGAMASGGRPGPAEIEVPAQRRPVLPGQAGSEERFREHLGQVIAKAFERNPRPAVAERVDTPSTSAQDEACGLCQGKCCLNGGPLHAYLNSDDINRRRLENPGATQESILSDYSARMAQPRVLGSCVFHGARGCTLPRRMRSDLCNSFICASQREIQEAEDSGQDRAILQAEFCGRVFASAEIALKGEDE